MNREFEMIYIHVMEPWSNTKSVMMRLLLPLIVIMSFIHGATSNDGLHYRNYNCPQENSNDSSLAFQANLNETLLNQLLPNSSNLKFFNSTKGTGDDQVNALFYCKGDIDAETCQNCVQAATRNITDVCKFQKQGIVWFEECTLRYSNQTIFGIHKEDHNFLYYNRSGDVNDNLLEPHKAEFVSNMTALIQQAAYSNRTVKCFATKEFNISSSQIIHGLAQCTPDIWGPKCYDCLTNALKLRNDLWEITMIFLPSCFFRYDLYGTAPPQLPPPPPSRRSLPVWSIVLIAIFSVVFISLAVIGGCWLWKRCSHEREPDPNSPRVTREQPVPVLPEISTDGQRRSAQGFRKYTFPQLEQMTNGFKKQIGRAAYGVVYQGLLLDGSREVAVKVLNENDAPKQFNNEIDVFGRISHKNLVSLLGYCEDGTKLGLIYEFMDKKDLRAQLSSNAGSLSWTQRLEIAIGTAEGLHYLHNHCEELIVHRDVKPENILLTGERELLQAKVADFGLSKIFPTADITTLETRVIGTHGYTAPEYHTTGLLNEKADVYSFGVVLLELITGVSPRLGFNLVTHFEKMFDTADIEKILDPRVTRNLNFSSVWGATELARSCVETKQEKRPDMWEIVVKLKQCLDMEINKNVEISSTGSTPIDMMSAMTSIIMAPEAR